MAVFNPLARIRGISTSHARLTSSCMSVRWVWTWDGPNTIVGGMCGDFMTIPSAVFSVPRRYSGASVGDAYRVMSYSVGLFARKVCTLPGIASRLSRSLAAKSLGHCFSAAIFWRCSRSPGLARRVALGVPCTLGLRANGFQLRPLISGETLPLPPLVALVRPYSSPCRAITVQTLAVSSSAMLRASATALIACFNPLTRIRGISTKSAMKHASASSLRFQSPCED